MAIHRTVLYTPDRKWRITADTAGSRITVEYQLVLVQRFTSLPMLERFLRKKGIELASLIQD